MRRLLKSQEKTELKAYVNYANGEFYLSFGKDPVEATADVRERFGKDVSISQSIEIEPGASYHIDCSLGSPLLSRQEGSIQNNGEITKRDRNG
mgnify:CR=1 FL=1